MISRSAIAIAVALLLVAVSGGAYLLQRMSYGDGFTAGELAGKASVAELEKQHEKALSKAHEDARIRTEALLTRLQTTQHQLNEIAGQLAFEQREYRETTDRLTGELARVTTQYRRSLDAAPEPLPACVFTRDFVRLYDQATGAYPLPATGDPERAVAPSAATDSAWDLDSGIGQRAFLAHHIRYAEQCRSTAAQLNRLIDAVATPGKTP